MKDNVTIQSRDISQYVLDWPRWSGYEVADGLLYATGDRLEPRRLTQDVDLVNPFAELALVPKDEQVPRLVEFTREFGLLGQSFLGASDRRIANAPPIVLPPNRRRRTPRPISHVKRAGDQIDWTLAHARNVDLIMRLHRARRNDLEQLLEWISSRIVTVREPEGLWSRTTHPGFLRVPLLTEPWFAHVRPADLREPGDSQLDGARRVVGALLNPNLLNVPREYQPTSDAMEFRFRALVQVLYWQLADRLGRWSLKRCRCGVMFFADDGRQGSHSPQCFRRFYMRGYRKGELRRARSKKKRG